jgi:P-type Mg2+ transporter
MDAHVKASAAAWWQTDRAELQAQLGASPGGLTSGEALERLQRFGPNQIRDAGAPPLLQFVRRFSNPLVLILLGASLISALVEEVASFVIITLMVLISVTLDFVQEFRAGKAAEKLRLLVQVRASVMRDGEVRQVALREVVPGDVALLSAGTLVSADGVLLEGRDLFVNQAMLTGEPYAVEKYVGGQHAGAGTLETAANVLFMGSSVVSGSGRMLVYQTGRATVVGQIAHTLAQAAPPTAFEVGVRRFGMLIMRLTVFLVLFVLLVNIMGHKPMLESFLFAIALAVGLTPELLPMVISVTLARGALRMAKAEVVVKRLSAIENLGMMNVLCTDKTGTLTEARIQLERHVDAAGQQSERVLQLAYLNSYFETGLRSPLDDAILAHEHLDVNGWRKIDEVPFDFERRRVSVLLDNGQERLLVLKGAPEDVLRLASAYEIDATGAVAALDAGARARAQAVCDDLGRQGFRVLGVASRKTAPDHPRAEVGDEANLVLAGFAAFLDPPKPQAQEALQALTRIGVAVKIVTGDNELVSQHICGCLGIGVTGVLTGAQIAQMDDQALRARVNSVNLFCRVNPAQKNRIILALKRGHTVGYLGDGVNDAPALHSADVGLSVDTAVDVAKEAADMILLRRDLGVLHDGVIEGRRTFLNIRKYIMMGTSSNFGNMFSMAGASLFLPFLPMLPVQILVNNALYDISELAIPLDRVDEPELLKAQQWNTNLIRNFMWAIGPVSSLFDFATFYILLKLLRADEALFHTGWFVESLATQVLVIFIIRTQRNPLRSRPHPALLATSFGAVIAAVLLPFTALGAAVGFVPPPARLLWIVAGLTVIYLALVEAVKRAFFRRFAR